LEYTPYDSSDEFEKKAEYVHLIGFYGKRVPGFQDSRVRVNGLWSLVAGLWFNRKLKTRNPKPIP